MVLAGFLLVKSGNSAVLAILGFLLTLVAAFVARVGWRSLGSTLTAYAFAARIPVLIVMFVAMSGGWGTHYDAVEARFAAASLMDQVLLRSLPAPNDALDRLHSGCRIAVRRDYCGNLRSQAGSATGVLAVEKVMRKRAQGGAFSARRPALPVR